MEVQIHHTGSRDGVPLFEVIRSMDMKRTNAVSLPEPADFAVEGHPSKKLLPQLRWYLEDYLQDPFGAYPQLAESTAETMRAWGAAVFDALFTGYARDWYQEAKRQNFEGFRIKISSDSPKIMSWPWEALYSQEDGYLALRCCIDRQLSHIGDPPPLPAAMPQDSIHILYIIPRPYGESDIGYHMLANSLIEYIEENSLPVTVGVLRPPTFEQLRKVLYEHPGYYHIVHFDGHGGYGTGAPSPTGDLYAAPEGQLVFETEDGKPDPVDAGKLAQLLAEYNIPFIVMNACRSGMIDGQAKDPFASVAAGLLKAGVRSVVAMGYSLYVSGAKKFFPAFYERLFSTGKVSEAMRAGRGKMLQQPERDCVIGRLPLQDWIVPVLYQQLSAESAVLLRIQPGRESERPSILPEGAKVDGDYGFIGRGRDIQKLERAIQRQPQAAILIHGQAGTGKTSLAKGFLRWLENTGGLRNRVFWFDFEDIYSVEYIVNQLIGELEGASSMAKPMEEKLGMLVGRLRREPYLLVWDNFESASGIEGTEIQPKLSLEGRSHLAQLLKALRGGKTKVLITSRSREAWLLVQACYRLPLGGLIGEDLWEYCNAVVRDLGLTVDRNNEAYGKLLDKLCGNPLAIRAILLRLQDCPVERLLAELESSFEGMEGDEGTRRLEAAYAVFGGSLTERFLPILQLTGLHEYYADTDRIRDMLNRAGCSIEPAAVDSCYRILEDAGFCTHLGQNVYRLHPALRGHLLKQTPAPASVEKGFVAIMGHLADPCTGKPLQKVGSFYQANTANFYHARHLAETHKMDAYYMALTQSLAWYAQEMRRFEEAGKLYAAFVEKAQLMNHQDGIAVAYHQLGMIAQEQRNFLAAETWCKKSLAIEEKQGNEHGAAITYHQLGRIAEEQQNFPAAETWYKKSLAIKKKYGDQHGAAPTYHQLGNIAEEKRDFPVAETWYRKSLAIKKKYGDQHGAAITYYQLGIIAQKQRDFPAAETWYKKALAITEKYRDQHRAAMAYHQLGVIAQEQGDFPTAETWCKKSLTIWEKQGNEHGAAGTYHELGVIAQKQGDFPTAETWYKKSLAITEKQGNEHGAALAYHQLGVIAQEQGGFPTAKAWYKKALAIWVNQGNEHNAASTYHQLGMIAQEQGNFPRAADFYLDALKIFASANDPHNLMIAVCNFARLLHDADSAERVQLRKEWSMCMDEELTNVLEQVEEELYDTSE